MITGIISGPIAGLIAALAFGLFGGSLFGLRFETLDRNKYVKPNQGIWNSGKNGLFFGLSIGLILVLASGLTNIMLRGLKINELILKSSAMLCLGLNAGLVLGGVAFFKHFILRWSLWRAGLVPWNYARFLDYAVEHIFLRKVGGGYIFVHRLLLEHFASPTIKPAPCGFIKNLRSSNQNS